MTNDNLNAHPDSGVGGERNFPGEGAETPATTGDDAYALDDTSIVPGFGEQTGASGYSDGVATTATDATASPGAYEGADYSTGTSDTSTYSSAGTGYSGAGYSGGQAGTSGVADSARHVAATARDEAADVASTAAAKAGEVKDVALERGEDVAAVAKDELGRLAGDAREQLQGLWDQAGSQLREQATAGRQQLAGLLHDLADELGEMASKSDQNGPVTAFAKQASRRGGELSHWLSNADSSDVLTEIRRFARRRPFAFLAGATVAGVVVGRLSRGLMAGRNTVGSSGATRAAEATGVAAPRPSAAVPAYGGGSTGQTYGYDRAVAGGEDL